MELTITKNGITLISTGYSEFYQALVQGAVRGRKYWYSWVSVRALADHYGISLSKHPTADELRSADYISRGGPREPFLDRLWESTPDRVLAHGYVVQ